jgi:hypothetical protein
MNWTPIGTTENSAAGYRCDMKSKARRGFWAAFTEKSASELTTPSPAFQISLSVGFF